MNSYTVWARMEVEVITEIRAESFEQASQKAGKLKAEDFLPENFVAENIENFEVRGFLKD